MRPWIRQEKDALSQDAYSEISSLPFIPSARTASIINTFMISCGSLCIHDQFTSFSRLSIVTKKVADSRMKKHNEKRFGWRTSREPSCSTNYSRCKFSEKRELAPENVILHLHWWTRRRKLWHSLIILEENCILVYTHVMLREFSFWYFEDGV